MGVSEQAWQSSIDGSYEVTGNQIVASGEDMDKVQSCATRKNSETNYERRYSKSATKVNYRP